MCASKCLGMVRIAHARRGGWMQRARVTSYFLAVTADLKNSSVILDIDNVVLLAKPLSAMDFAVSPDDEAARQQRAKQETCVQAASLAGDCALTYAEAACGRQWRSGGRSTRRCGARPFRRPEKRPSWSDPCGRACQRLLLTQAVHVLQDKVLLYITRLIKINIRNVHIQYEDDVTDPLHPFTLGLGIESVSLDACQVSAARF